MPHKYNPPPPPKAQRSANHFQITFKLVLASRRLQLDYTHTRAHTHTHARTRTHTHTHTHTRHLVSPAPSPIQVQLPFHGDVRPTHTRRGTTPTRSRRSGGIHTRRDDTSPPQKCKSGGSQSETSCIANRRYTPHNPARGATQQSDVISSEQQL